MKAKAEGLYTLALKNLPVMPLEGCKQHGYIRCRDYVALRLHAIFSFLTCSILTVQIHKTSPFIFIEDRQFVTAYFTQCNQPLPSVKTKFKKKDVNSFTKGLLL